MQNEEDDKMSGTQFDRDSMAQRYASNHLETDPGIQTVYYLPRNAPDREIRLVEVNELMAERADDPLEPLNFGVDVNGTNSHTLMVLDITPSQWEKIGRQELRLPADWSLESPIPFLREHR